MLLHKKLRAAVLERADPLRATGMRAYMKSAMPYLGVPSPQMRAISKTVFAGLRYENSAK